MASEINTKIVILAGGQGARFWPLSRKHCPKQFLSISNDGESLIQATARRVESINKINEITVVTNYDHVKLVKEHLPGCSIIIEPCARNTAAAIGLAAIKLRKQYGDNAVLVILSADHVVKNEQGLCSLLQEAIKTAAGIDCLVTIGLKPVIAHTGYGYIKAGNKISGSSYKVARFYEKPNQERAIKYLESGDYYWNSGMFAWRCSSILEAITLYMPELAKALAKIEKAINTIDEDKVIAAEFEQLESISIDFGVLEHATNCAVVVANDIGWSDVGSWDAWSEHFQKDPQGNLVKGDAILIDSKNCVVYSNRSKIAVLGAEDMIVIDAGDALLVCPRSHVQDVKKIVQELERRGDQALI